MTRLTIETKRKTQGIFGFIHEHGDDMYKVFDDQLTSSSIFTHTNWQLG